MLSNAFLEIQDCTYYTTLIKISFDLFNKK
uniref:Uncharacterized protein n=1 Tax=Anguilla anguilla TaxID=7936 RepID=A0A0E9V9X9_ANGAN